MKVSTDITQKNMENILIKESLADRRTRVYTKNKLDDPVVETER